jgi:hypothetical protein
MDDLDDQIEQKMSHYFICISCDYSTCKKTNYDRHILSDKHQRMTKSSKMDDQNEQNEQNEQNVKFKCICGNIYKFKQGLSKHKKTCSRVNTVDEKNDIKMLTNLVLEVVKQNKELVVQNTETHKHNQELTSKIVEICKAGTTNNTQINNTNNNNTFNLNVFLNEKCKDAMNIMDFVDSLQLQLSDLEDVGKLGFVEGISNIIVKNLKALDVTERPIHCADKKREIIYVKDDDKWEKECDQKLKIRKAIKRVATKNQKLLPKFKEAHPGCNYSESKYSDQYSKIVIESMRDDDVEKQDKIIKRIAKEVVIDKTNN